MDESLLESEAEQIRRFAALHKVARGILDCLNTEEALKIIESQGILKETMEIAMERILF